MPTMALGACQHTAATLHTHTATCHLRLPLDSALAEFTYSHMRHGSFSAQLAAVCTVHLLQ